MHRHLRHEWNPMRWNTWAWGWFLALVAAIGGAFYVENEATRFHVGAAFAVAYICTVALDHSR